MWKYGEDGTGTHHQVLIPKELAAELLSTLQEGENKHPGITKMIGNSELKTTTRE